MPKGLTIVELIIAILLAVIVTLAVAAVIGDAQKDFNSVYNRTFCEAVAEGHIMRRVFPAVIRQASSSSGSTSLAGDGSWIEVQYYSSDEVEDPDRYAKFYEYNNELVLERGILEPRETLSLQVVCENVSSVKFASNGASAQMLLELDDGQQQYTLNYSAVMHNP